MSQGFFLFKIILHQQTDLSMPIKKNMQYEGKIEKLPDKKIFINVNHLEKGNYELNIINQNKLLVKTKFKK